MNDQWPPKEIGPLWPNQRIVDRIAEFDIPIEVFLHRALFDRVLVWQIPEDHGGADTVKLDGGVKLYKPETTIARERQQNPRGVIISAGLHAYTALRSHGSDIGNIVRFVRLAPWRITVGREGKKDIELFPLRADNLVVDDDQALDVHEGRLTLAWDNYDYYYRERGVRTDPATDNDA